MRFVVERRMPNVKSADLAMLQETLVFACDRLTSLGEPVICLGSTFLPGRARLLTEFEAESAETVRRANEAVHAPFDSLEMGLKIDLVAGGGTAAPLPDPASEPGP